MKARPVSTERAFLLRKSLNPAEISGLVTIVSAVSRDQLETQISWPAIFLLASQLLLL